MRFAVKSGFREILDGFFAGMTCKKFDPALDGFVRIGNRKFQVESHHAAETAAFGAGADGRIEAEHRGLGGFERRAAVGAHQSFGVTAFDNLIGVGGNDPHENAAFVGAQTVVAGFLEGLDAALIRRFFHLEAVGGDPKRRTFFGFFFVFDVGEALSRQVGLQAFRIAVFRFKNGKQNIDAGVGISRHERFEVFPHVARGHFAHGPAAVGAEKMRFVGKEKLQMVVQFRHRADGGTGRSHRAALIDGDRGRNAVDFVYLGAVAALQKLTGIRTEGFCVAPLAFGVEGVKGERTFTGSRRSRDDCESTRSDIDVHIFKVVLLGAADGDERRFVGRIAFRHSAKAAESFGTPPVSMVSRSIVAGKSCPLVSKKCWFFSSRGQPTADRFPERSVGRESARR